MKSRTFLLVLTLLCEFTLFSANTFAQNDAQLNLPEGAKARLGKGWINKIAYFPDGMRLAVASSIGIWVYDVETGEALDLLTEHTDGVSSVSFSPDGSILASGSWDDTVRLWDVETGMPFRTLEGHTDGVSSVSFSPDGSTLASGSWDDTVRLWDIETGVHLRTLEGHRWGHRGLHSVSFSPDGKTLASVGHEDTVLLWDVETGVHLRTLQGHIYGVSGVSSVSFSPDGKVLASGNWDDTVRLWDVETGMPFRTLEGHTGGVISVSFSPDGRRLASGSWDDTVRLWDVATGVHLRTFQGHIWYVHSVSFSPDGRRLASGSWDDTVRLWDVATGVHLRTFQGHTDSISSISFSPDGKVLASGSGNHPIRLWDVATGVHLRALQGFGSVSFSPDGKVLASAGDKDIVLLWDVATGVHLRTLQGFGSVSFSPNSKVLASGSADETVRLWDVETGVHLRTLQGHTGEVFSVSFSPDGRRLASGSSDNTVRLWDVATGVHLRTLQGHTGGVESVSFSPNSKVLASGSADETVRLWDVATGVHLRTLQGHTGGVESVSFSPDGSTLASGSADETVRLWDVWDVETDMPFRTLAGHTGGVSSVSFSPDGKVLASGSADGTVLLWEPTPAPSFAGIAAFFGLLLNLLFPPASSTPAPEPVEPVPPSTDEPDQQLSPVVYWIEEGTIFRLDGGNKQALVEPLEGWTVTSLAMDMARNILYWTERQTGKQIGSIWSGDLNDRNVRELRRITAVPESIVVDSENGRLYWTNNRGKIQSINVDGKNFRGNLITGLGSPHHVALDSATGNIYWTANNGDGSWSIWRAPFDGNITKKEIMRGLGQLGGIAVANDKLYWTEGGKISCANKRNGSGVKTLILLRGTVLLGLAVDEVGRRLYWTDNGGNIRSLNLGNPLEIEIVVRGSSDTPAVAIALGRSLGGSAPASPAAPSTIAERSVESALLENYPNPFNPETWIPYQLSAAADVSISIYSVNGHLVRHLDLGHQSSGVYRSRSRAAYWDGRNEFGERVASGLYFYTLTAGDFTATRKMLIRK